MSNTAKIIDYHIVCQGTKDNTSRVLLYNSESLSPIATKIESGTCEKLRSQLMKFDYFQQLLAHK